MTRTFNVVPSDNSYVDQGSALDSKSICSASTWRCVTGETILTMGCDTFSRTLSAPAKAPGPPCSKLRAVVVTRVAEGSASIPQAKVTPRKRPIRQVLDSVRSCRPPPGNLYRRAVGLSAAWLENRE